MTAGSRSALVATCVALWLLAAEFSFLAPVQAAPLTRSAKPLASKPSVPPCSPRCGIIFAPRPSTAQGLEYEGSGPEGGFTPRDLRNAYNLPERGGSGSTIAIVTGPGDPRAEANLAEYRSAYNLPECSEANGCFKQLDEYGEPHRPEKNGQWIGEISLDLDMVSAACPECHIWLLEAKGPTERSGLIKANETAVQLGADIVTNSWNFGYEEGNPVTVCGFERCVSAEEEAVYDESFDRPGTPILFSGGDYGYVVRYPAISPYVISVGGTTLKRDPESPRGWREEAWSNPEYEEHRKGRGTGSGCSLYEPKPPWQTDLTCPNRMGNDIAVVGDFRTPVATYSSQLGGWRLSGGTSVSAPFVAGVLGLSSPEIQEMGAEAFWKAGPQGQLFDITEGSNGTCTPPSGNEYWCTAVPGYDGPTGWGTPNGTIAIASPPYVTTASGASERTQTIATVGGTVNPSSGAISECKILYGLKDSYGSEVPCDSLPERGTEPVPVSAHLSGLEINTTYHFRLVAANGAGEGEGDDGTFETLPEAPSAENEPVGVFTQTTAVPRGRVDNNGTEGGATCKFIVAPADAPSLPLAEVPCGSSPITGDGSTLVQATATGLSVNTRYVYRLVAQNAGGTVTAMPPENFQTLPNAPTVITGQYLSGLSQTTATVNGTVNPNSGEVSGCKVLYGPTAGYGSEAPCDSLPGDGPRAAPVSAPLSGLAPNTTYHFRFLAANPGGSGRGGDETLHTPPEECATDPALCPPSPLRQGESTKRSARRICIAKARRAFRKQRKAALRRHGRARREALRRAVRRKRRVMSKCRTRFRKRGSRRLRYHRPHIYRHVHNRHQR